MKPISTLAALKPTVPPDLQSTPNSIGQLAANVTNLLLLLVGITAVIMIIVGGFQYVFSAGDSNRTKTAKDTILFSVIGLIIALLAYAIVHFVLGRFGG